MTITSGGVDNMETYKYIIGQINALEATKQEISNLLDNKEHNETKGTVININGSPSQKIITPNKELVGLPKIRTYKRSH